MEKLKPVSVGEIMLHEFLEPMGVSQNKLAKVLDVPVSRISDIVHARRRLTGDMALRLSKAFWTTPQFWMTIQNSYDLAVAEDCGVPDIQPLDMAG